MDEESIPDVPLGLGLAIHGGILGMIGGGMEQMFGEKIPKGVVKELMEGALAGTFQYFDGEMFDLKQEIEGYQDEIRDLKIELRKWEGLYDESNMENCDLKKEVENLKNELVVAQNLIKDLKKKKNRKKGK